MNIVDLEVSLYRSGVQFIHFAPTAEAAMAAKYDFDWELQAQDQECNNPGLAKFILASYSATNAGHVPVVIVENAHHIRSQVMDEIKAVPASEKHQEAMLIFATIERE